MASSHPTRYPRLSQLALPITRLELPGWGKAFAAFKIGGSHDDLWKDAPTKVIRGKWHGYRMDLDLRNWSERHSYFLGRFYDFPTQAVMAEALRPGDRAVDVGANIGMMTLHAAALVGPTGRVDACEPNPACQRRIKAQLDRNAIGHVVLHGVALSDRPGSLTLRVPTTHTGTGTLANLSEADREHFCVEVPVEVEVGDEVIGRDPRPVDFVKVDVEGFECHTLRGLKGTLERWKPPVVTEVIEEWLGRAGSSTTELLDLMTGLGYEGFRMGEIRKGLRRGLHLEPYGRPKPNEAVDVLWVHPQGRNRERIVSLPGLATPSR